MSFSRHVDAAVLGLHTMGSSFDVELGKVGSTWVLQCVHDEEKFAAKETTKREEYRSQIAIEEVPLRDPH